MLVARNVREEFCRDLRSYLEEALQRRRTHVVVRVGRLAKLRGKSHRRVCRYSAYLRQLFGEYRFAKGTYILPREKAEDVYNSLDALCEILKEKRRREKGRKRIKETKSEKMERVTFHVPPSMLRDLDEAAKILGKKRAEIVREAIQQMLKTYILQTPEEKDAPEESVQRDAYRNVEDAIHQLAQRLNSA